MRRVALIAALLLLIAGAVFGRPEHPHFWWDRVPAFAALLGLAGGAVLVVVFKTLGERWLQRPEDYYDR